MNNRKQDKRKQDDRKQDNRKQEPGLAADTQLQPRHRNTQRATLPPHWPRVCKLTVLTAARTSAALLILASHACTYAAGSPKGLLGNVALPSPMLIRPERESEEALRRAAGTLRCERARLAAARGRCPF